MGRPSIVDQLPPEVRIELRRRLLETNFRDFEKHEAWLNSIGHEGSKTAIQRYAVFLKDEITNQRDIRMRCLEVAAAVAPDQKALIPASEELLAWVKKGSPEALG